MKVLLIDDHALFRDGILLVLDGLNTAIETFEAGSYESAVTIIDEQQNLELILLDLGLPGINGIDALIAIKKRSPNSLVVVLSGTEGYKVIDQALRHGAQGYIPKSSSAKIMLSALQLVISGGTYVPPEILNHSPLNETPIPANHSNERKLTTRQCEVLQKLATGKSNREIGASLGLTESTIRAHVAAIFKSLNVGNRTQAVQYARQRGWIKSQEHE